MLLTAQRLHEIIVEELSREALSAFVSDFSERHQDKWAKDLGEEIGWSADIKPLGGDYPDLDAYIQQYVEEAALQTIMDAGPKAVDIAKKAIEKDVTSLRGSGAPGLKVMPGIFKDTVTVAQEP